MDKKTSPWWNVRYKCFVRCMEQWDLIGKGQEAGMKSKRLAVTDDHTDLRIFSTQPRSLGSPCPTVLQGTLCIIRRLLPCMLLNQRLTGTQCSGSEHVPTNTHLMEHNIEHDCEPIESKNKCNRNRLSLCNLFYR